MVSASKHEAEIEVYQENSKRDEKRKTTKTRIMIKKEDLFQIFNIDDVNDLPKSITNILDGCVDKRNDIYLRLLEINNYDISYDWFQLIYENEMAQRKDKKQDFTPNSLGKILSKLTGYKPSFIHEPTAGNGSLLITNWWHRCVNSPYPILHKPWDNPVECWELSNRSIPILLLNLSIRGMVGVVTHGDVIEQTIKSRYILNNPTNDTLGFSEIIKIS